MAEKTATKDDKKVEAKQDEAKTAAAASKAAPAAGKTVSNVTAPRIKWDGNKMATSYANFANVTGTREEFTLLFGLNETWEPDKPVVRLSERVVLSPYVAKRFASLLEGVVSEYEKRFGDLPIDQ